MHKKNQELGIRNQALREIVEKTREDLNKTRPRNPLASLRVSKFGMIFRKGKVAVIGEVKFASPSEGFLGSQADFIKRIKEYERAGVDAISIVTEKHFFKGDPSFVAKAKQTSNLAVLQKDFVVDVYQIYEAKQAGADAVLLIAKIVSKEELIMFVKLARGIGIEPVVEINDSFDLKKALATETNIIAVNARDLDTFEVNVDKACKLLKKVPSKFIKLGFSGIHSAVEVEKYKKAGVQGVLIGTSLMRVKDIQDFIKRVRGSCHRFIPSVLVLALPLRGADELRAVGSPSPMPPAKQTVKVKICGIRSLEAANAAVDAGADFLGFNFVPTSKRLIPVDKARKIINSIKGKVKIVGVFKNQPIEYVNDVVKKLSLDFVQLHGSESPEYVSEVKAGVIKVSSLLKLRTMSQYSVPLYLLDRENQGEGKMVDLKKARKVAQQFPLFYSGGLTPENVLQIAEKVQPYAVDVAGGIETNGNIDINKIKAFIVNAKVKGQKAKVQFKSKKF